jgi:hypothetical protein
VSATRQTFFPCSSFAILYFLTFTDLAYTLDEGCPIGTPSLQLSRFRFILDKG